MGEIARLKSEIQARKYRATVLAAEIDRRVRDIKDVLSGHPFTKPEDIRLSLVADIAEELEKIQAEYLKLLKEIETAEKELNG
jgi:hypothetical protein